MSDDESLREVSSRIRTLRFLVGLLLTGSFLSLVACCGYIYYEHHYGYRGPDAMRGLDLPAAIALCVLYVVILFVPTLLVARKESGGLIVIFGFLNMAGIAMTIIGFLSLLM